ncbi:restriction endonuclease [Candidatus Wolfebacteria bacterium]|nr:restriction endonuclease [Candidatus Wolfebacteria bacterium]
MVLVTKANGEEELFQPDKLRRSLERAGAHAETVARIVTRVEGELRDGMTTAEIYRHAFELLKREEDKPIAARYSLRRAIMELGPSGFPFESFLAELFRQEGYRATTNVYLSGKCTEHEIDVLAENDARVVAVEAKFHNESGYKTDLKGVLYVNARAGDLKETHFDGKETSGKEGAVWLITNTKFTHNAIRYAECAGLTIIGWTYPHHGNLHDLIDASGLHPVSCLTTLSQAQKNLLLERRIVLCRFLMEHPETLQEIGLSAAKTDTVIQEARGLCAPRR